MDLSRNGVTLNGVKLKKDEYVALKDGDVVRCRFTWSTGLNLTRRERRRDRRARC